MYIRCFDFQLMMMVSMSRKVNMFARSYS